MEQAKGTGGALAPEGLPAEPARVPGDLAGARVRGWIGVDLDATLARYDGWRGPGHVGEPVPEVLAAVRRLMREGREVRIFTARACIPQQVPPVLAWMDRHGLGALAVVHEKDLGMAELWDDRCVQYIPNTGIRVEDLLSPEARRVLDEARAAAVLDCYSGDYLRAHAADRGAAETTTTTTTTTTRREGGAA